MIGHVDCMDDIEMHGAIAEAGAFVGYDRVGSLRYQADEVRIRLVTEMISRGYEKNIILSCDLATRHRMRCRGELGYSCIYWRLRAAPPRRRGDGKHAAANPRGQSKAAAHRRARLSMSDRTDDY